MSVALITGSAGLVGSETVCYFCERGFDVAGIDNDMRRAFFGEQASTVWMRRILEQRYSNYRHFFSDIRDRSDMEGIFRHYANEIELIVHAAAQPSHDWAARDPLTDFGINANGTLNLLELTRQFCPDAVFIFTSTNKVYGDTPNSLPLIELETRWDLDPSHPYARGIDESMSIDGSLHSLFGASKVAADILVQEYGRYFGLKTVCFRGGCLTGPNHSGAMLHGFLAYLMQCVVVDRPYKVYGYKGKQVRDNIHSSDLVETFYHFYQNPRPGEVYNIGGSRYSHCSIIEAIALCEEIVGKKLNWTYSEENRIGDHIWYVSDIRKFQSHYPGWRLKYDLRRLIEDIYAKNVDRWKRLSE